MVSSKINKIKYYFSKKTLLKYEYFVLFIVSEPLYFLSRVRLGRKTNI